MCFYFLIIDAWTTPDDSERLTISYAYSNRRSVRFYEYADEYATVWVSISNGSKRPTISYAFSIRPVRFHEYAVQYANAKASSSF
jgi:hypothetical protein